MGVRVARFTHHDAPSLSLNSGPWFSNETVVSTPQLGFEPILGTSGKMRGSPNQWLASTGQPEEKNDGISEYSDNMV